MPELTLSEIEKSFLNFKEDIFWLNITGGEPFLREDLAEICKSAYRNLHAKMINIPTNGILFQAISKNIDKILTQCPKARISLNFSLDEFGEKHDALRGASHNFELAMNTYRELRKIKNVNFSLGIHTVLSRYNIADFPNFFMRLIDLKPDLYTVEIAQEKAELDNMGLDLQPDLEDYLQITRYLTKYLVSQKCRTIVKMIKSFHFHYYELAAKMLKEKKQAIPCYAGFNSAYITCDGNVWACCVKAKSMGNLKNSNYDFRKIWFSSSADDIRRQIKNNGCFCPVAGVNYLNMLCDLHSLWKIGLRFLRSCLR